VCSIQAGVPRCLQTAPCGPVALGTSGLHDIYKQAVTGRSKTNTRPSAEATAVKLQSVYSHTSTSPRPTHPYSIDSVWSCMSRIVRFSAASCFCFFPRCASSLLRDYDLFGQGYDLFVPYFGRLFFLPPDRCQTSIRRCPTRDRGQSRDENGPQPSMRSRRMPQASPWRSLPRTCPLGPSAGGMR